VAEEGAAEVEERADAAVRGHPSGRGRQNAGDEMQKSRFADAVRTDQADRLATANVEADVAQNGKRLRPSAARRECIAKPQKRRRVESELLRDVVESDRRRFGHRINSRNCRSPRVAMRTSGSKRLPMSFNATR